MDQIPCPDGYLLDARSPLAEGHHALNQYLVRVEEAGWQTAMKEINGLRNKPRKLLAWRALLERMRWLKENHSTGRHDSALRGLAERIEKWSLDLTEADLIALLQETAEAADALAPYTPVPHVMAYVEERGLTPGLAAAIRRFRERVYDLDYAVNQVSLQLFRSRLDMLAWRDEWNEIDRKRCWSEQVRADYRAMQGAERESWRRLLYSIHGDESGRPAGKWVERASAIAAGIGPDSFRDRLLGWFQVLQPGVKQKLSREGSFILRSLLWLIEANRDPRLLEKAREIARVEFTPKANGQKVIRAAAEALGHPDPTVKPPVAAPGFHSLVGRALSSVLSPGAMMMPPEFSGRIEISGETAFVRGDLDSYQMDLSTGTIVRGSDGKRVRVRNSVLNPAPADLPEFGGITGKFRQLMILAQDAEHAASLIAESDE
ncbi:MAG: hypothetical protein K2X35_06370 [Bryobacteraceae bacterium]|nr:hypothetical protein [Bryobacteraceae bacterium]